MTDQIIEATWVNQLLIIKNTIDGTSICIPSKMLFENGFDIYIDNSVKIDEQINIVANFPNMIMNKNHQIRWSYPKNQTQKTTHKYTNDISDAIHKAVSECLV